MDEDIEVLLPDEIRAERTTEPYGYRWEEVYDPSSNRVGYQLVREEQEGSES